MSLTRRHLLGLLGAAALPAVAGPDRHTEPRRRRPRVVVLGGGFAGATAARYLARWGAGLEIVHVVPPGTYWTCPFSNTAVAGLRRVDDLAIGYAAIAADPRIELVRATAAAIDPEARRLRLADGSTITYDRLVAAPGIEIHGDAIEGYDAEATRRFPHAWEAGPATAVLRRRLEAVPADGLVVITAPENPYRCPPGPYERASLMAWWLERHRPGARVVILDAKDTFTKDALFRAAWAERYPHLEWIGRGTGGTLRRVDAATGELFTDFDRYQPDLACVIPPQRASRLLRAAGLDDGRGWCPVDPTSFESTVHPGIHVIGDAAIANPMPKSAFAANSQAKACAAAVVALVHDAPVPEPVLMNTCYSLVAPDAGIAIAGAYGVTDGRLTTIPGTAGVSEADAGAEVRRAESDHARGWYEAVVADAFG